MQMPAVFTSGVIPGQYGLYLEAAAFICMQSPPDPRLIVRAAGCVVDSGGIGLIKKKGNIPDRLICLSVNNFTMDH